jgi:hypothetical protein
MQVFKNQSFEGRSFDLEETVFIECQLTNCDLFYSGGDVEIVRSKMDNCPLHWRGAAKNTVFVLQSLGLLPDLSKQKIPIQVNISGQNLN